MESRQDRIILKQYYPHTSNAEIGRMLGVSAGCVAARGHLRGYRKDKAYISSVNKQNGSRGTLLHGRPKSKAS